ncbi:MAG TPA: LptA/OstA family protein [Syntrophales bacterium]|nr:LptA/OstA family protein [Syntrophales bacterium]
MENKILIPLILIFISFSYLGAKEVNTGKKLKLDKDQPIQIVSDRLDAYNEKKLVIFSGNAVATKGDITIKADRLLLYYKKDPRVPEKAGAQSIGNTGDLEKIEAKGHVTITKGERIVTGDDAIFYQDTQKIIINSNAVMREGRNIIHGDRIVVYLNEDRGVVESLEKNRVNATIYPEDGKDKKK